VWWCGRDWVSAMFAGAFMSFVKRFFGRSHKADQPAADCQSTAAADGDPPPSVGRQPARYGRHRGGKVMVRVCILCGSDLFSEDRRRTLPKHVTVLNPRGIDPVCCCYSCHSKTLYCNDCRFLVRFPRVSSVLPYIAITLILVG